MHYLRLGERHACQVVIAATLGAMVEATGTAAIISLLTHICIPVALNIVVHPRLTYEH